MEEFRRGQVQVGPPAKASRRVASAKAPGSRHGSRRIVLSCATFYRPLVDISDTDSEKPLDESQRMVRPLERKAAQPCEPRPLEPLRSSRCLLLQLRSTDVTEVLVCTNALEEGVDVSDPWACRGRAGRAIRMDRKETNEPGICHVL